MAAPEPQPPQLQVDRFRVEHREGLSFPCFHLANRRAAGHPTTRWICQRHLEILLFNRVDGGSTGAIWKVLNIAGVGSTSLCCSRRAVTDGVITQAEFAQIMTVFKQALPPEHCDPSSLGRIRFCTLLPIATAALVCRQHGRSGASLAWLRAFSQSVPESWVLHEQREQHAANNEVDLVLEAQIEAQGDFEAEDVSFREELTTMPTFAPVADDDKRLATYILNPVPSILKKELDEYIIYRTSTFAARRQGGAVQSVSAEHDKTCLLRFFGFLTRTDRVPEGALLYLSFMIRADVGALAQEYAQWLQNTQGCRFSSIANYLNGLVSVLSFCYAHLEPTDVILNSDPNPLAQIINLRGQAEKASKTQRLYSARVGGWLEWEDVQKARVKCLNALAETEAGGTLSEKRFALRDAAAISLLSLIPPDRVGCIRKLRLGQTLKRKPGGGWKIDFSSIRDQHKTSRFYGPFAASLPDALSPVLDKYARVLEMEPGGDAAYFFHPPQSGFDRSMEPSAWTGWVKRLFKRWHGTEIAPKTLRSVFITWLRDQEAAPEVLKSAAHAMKHSEARQASGDYDQEADDRLVKAAFQFNLQYAAQYAAEVGASGEASGSSAPPAPALPPLPDGELNDAQIAARMALLQVEWVDADQTELKGTANTSVDDVKILLDRMGADVCKLTIPPDREYHFNRSDYGERVLNCTSRPLDGASDGDDDEMLLVDEEWQPLDGGPWVARLMRSSRQPVPTATYRNFQLALNFDPVTTVLMPNGQIKLPVIAGGPSDGLKLQLPNSWTIRTRTLMFRLKLSKAGATSNEVTINQILYRAQVPLADTEDEDGPLLAHEPPVNGEEQPPEAAAGAVVPLAKVPHAALAAAAPGGGDDDPESVSDSEDDAAARAPHPEVNLGMPMAGDGTMAERAREMLARSSAPLPGEGEAAVEPPNAGDVPSQHAEQMGAIVAAAPEVEEAPADDAADDAMEGAAVVVEEVAQAAGEPATPAPPPPAAQPPAPPSAAPPRASARGRKRKERFGDNGELDGPASAFRSAPSARKASIDPVEEMNVPTYALPGETVFAMGLHAGTRKRFKARVIKLRKMFPRIVVKYIEDESGNTNPLALPDPITAYLMMSDVEPGTLLMS